MRVSFSGSNEVTAPRRLVWQRLLDPQFVAASAPGVEKVEQVDDSHFQLLSFAAQAAVVWAAIMNPVAAIGLWLGAAWGVVLWLVTTLVQILISATAPEGVGSLYIVAAVEAVLVIAYGVVAFRAGREEQD